MAKKTKAYIALLFICIVWGTTYLTIRIGVTHYPPFLFAGVRQSVAGILLMIAALSISRAKNLSTKNILLQMLIGFLMLTLGNGLVSLGLRFIPSGVSALICSTMPVFAVIINLFVSKKDHFNPTIGIGLLVGVLGVALIFRNNLSDISQPAYMGGILATLVATGAWALGTVLNKWNDRQVNAFFDSGLQLFFGGVFMLVISPFADNYSNFHLWNAEGAIALGYLIVFGSALAYAAYMYSLNELPVGIATLYAYINPLIAVVAGAVFLKEDLNIYIGMSFMAVVVSVYLINRGYRKQHVSVTTSSHSKIEEAFPESIPLE